VNCKVSDSNIVWCERYKTEKLFVRGKKVLARILIHLWTAQIKGIAKMVLRKSCLCDLKYICWWFSFETPSGWDVLRSKDYSLLFIWAWLYILFSFLASYWFRVRLSKRWRLFLSANSPTHREMRSPAPLPARVYLIWRKNKSVRIHSMVIQKRVLAYCTKLADLQCQLSIE
jgi:hypothetical protein